MGIIGKSPRLKWAWAYLWKTDTLWAYEDRLGMSFQAGETAWAKAERFRQWVGFVQENIG